MSRRFRLIFLLSAMMLATIFIAPLYVWAASGKTAAVPMATYTDPVGGVSFDYPFVWKIDNSAKFYLAPHILQGQHSPQIQVIFSPAGNYYAKTNLTDLVFVYRRVPHQSDKSCANMAIGSVPAKLENTTINGQLFQHFDTGDAGMCHGVDQHIYWTNRGGTCYLFEGDMHTTCSGAVDGQRDLTPAETRALLRHLNAIPQSIRFRSLP